MARTLKMIDSYGDAITLTQTTADPNVVLECTSAEGVALTPKMAAAIIEFLSAPVESEPEAPVDPLYGRQVGDVLIAQARELPWHSEWRILEIGTGAAGRKVVYRVEPVSGISSAIWADSGHFQHN